MTHSDVRHEYVVFSWTSEDNTFILHWKQTVWLYCFQGCLILVHASPSLHLYHLCQNKPFSTLEPVLGVWLSETLVS